MIKNCPHCIPHTYQDDKYGKNQRVCNWSIKQERWVCTVCAAVLLGAGDKKVKK